MKVQTLLDTFNIIDDIKLALTEATNKNSGAGGYLTIDEETAEKVMKITHEYESYLLGLEVRSY